jgi:hypothetical protein
MQAVERALANKNISKDQRAEAHALLGRNAKSLWRRDWQDAPDTETKAAAALRSSFLQESFEQYERAFDEDLNHFYSG